MEGVLRFVTTLVVLCTTFALKNLRFQLIQISPDHVIAVFPFPDPTTRSLDAEEWNKRFEKQMVESSEEFHPETNDGAVPERPRALIDSQAPSDTNLAEGRASWVRPAILAKAMLEGRNLLKEH